MNVWPSPQFPTPLSQDEQQALDLSGELASAVHRLCFHEGHDTDTAAQDWNELAHHLHYIQRAIQSNAAARAYPAMCRRLGGVIPGTEVKKPRGYGLWKCPVCSTDNDYAERNDACKQCGWALP